MARGSLVETASSTPASTSVLIAKHCGDNKFRKRPIYPLARLTPALPFSYVGLHVFRPWLVSDRRTKGGFANSTRCAMFFTCLVTRAIHIDVEEFMDSSSFINAPRPFLALRGPVVQFRSDWSITISILLEQTMNSKLHLMRWIALVSSPTLLRGLLLDIHCSPL